MGSRPRDRPNTAKITRYGSSKIFGRGTPRPALETFRILEQVLVDLRLVGAKVQINLRSRILESILHGSQYCKLDCVPIQNLKHPASIKDSIDD